MEMMPPNDANGSRREGHHEIVEVVVDDPSCTPSSGTMRLMDFIPIYIPTVEKGALSRSRRKRRFLDFLRAHPSKDWFLRSTFVGRRTHQQKAEEDPAPPDSDEGGPRRRFRVPFVRKIKWAKLWSYAASWCRKPANLAMLVWLGFVAAGLLIVLMLMTGMLNDAIPESERRKRWTEVTNQILNALFTIMCLYQHPKIFHHLVLLLRWRIDDRVEVRKVYCKDGAARPRDRAHMLVVVALLHVTCVAQYYCCALFWSYSRRDRPDWALNIGYGLGTGCPVIAGLYAAYSPLGRKRPDEPTDTEESSSTAGAAAEDQGGNHHQAENDEEVEIKIYNRRVVVSSPEWSGGVFDCCDDATVCAASACCTFCVFGWNMERLGLGNMYVHAFTFALLFAAPLLIFSVTALNVNDPDVRDVVVAAGVLCGFCGFLYGGFWRTQMRKRYKLPAGSAWLCGGGAVGAAMGDCARWLFCWSCALAQEVRTANFYDVEDDRFVVAVLDDARNRVLVPLPREASSTAVHHSRSLSCPPKIVDETGGAMTSPLVGVEMMAAGAMKRSATYHPMRPPMPPLIQMDREAE